MCGIAGYIATEKRDGAAMVRALKHRGPDAQGDFATEVHGSQVYLGHARLSIIDLSSAGNQPMFAANGRIALVFNGEIYNFQDLRNRYLRDRPFHSGSDTEVLLALYEYMGIDCLEHLNGDFAIAILDRVRDKLFLVRDRVGVKPLYYTHEGSDLIFGSEIKALLAAGVRPVLAEEHLQRYFVFKYTPGEATLFRGIRRLPPGHYLEYDLRSRRGRMTRYWSACTTVDRSLSYAEAKARLVALMSDATQLRLIADVPVGNFLSGGMDSAVVASFLRERPQIAHYCARQSAADVAREGTVSDFAHACRLATDWGLQLRSIDIGAAEVTLAHISRSAWYADDLIADSAQIPTFLITQGAASTSRVFLSGMGADELFLGYAGHLLTLLAGYLDHLPGHRWLLGALAGIAQGRGRLKSVRRYLYRLGKYRDYGSCRPAIFSLVGDFESSAALVPGDPQDILDDLAGYFPPDSDPFEGFKRFEFDNFLQKNLAYTDRMSMANSVEVRVPFLDHRLVDLAGSLPRHFKLSPFGRAKRILKDAFADRVPRYVIRRRKAGFAMPIRSIFSDRERVLALLDSGVLADGARVDLTAVRTLIDRHAAGLEDHSSLIYAVLSLQEWYKLFFK